MRALVILLMLAGAGYWWHNRRERYQQLESLQMELKAVEGMVAEKKKLATSLTGKVIPLREGQAAITAEDGSPDKLQEEVAALREAMTTGAAQLDAAEDDFAAAVEAVRENAKGKKVGNLKLSNGEELVDCEIQRFGEGYIQFMHRDGSEKVMADELPEEMVDRYAVNYVSRHSKEENALLAGKVEEAVLTPLDLKKAKLEEIDARIAELSAQLLALNGRIREATRQADLMVRNAYRISLGNSSRGSNSGASQREQMFAKAKQIESARESVRAKYVALRNEKLRLEKQRLLVKRAPLNPAPVTPQ
jgi:hypothetical protein